MKSFKAVRAGHIARSHGSFAESMIRMSANKENIVAIQIPTGAQIRKIQGRLVACPIRTPFDFVLYKVGKTVTLDIKFTENTNFKYSLIVDHQVESLMRIQQTNQTAGYLVFFEKCNRVVFYFASQLIALKPRESLKPDDGINIGSMLALNLSLLF